MGDQVATVVRRPARPWSPALPHSPGLDGVRAVAVLAVLGYHLDLAVLGGGFLAMAAFQLTWAGAWLRLRDRRLERAGIAANAGIIGVWIWSRFVGLPVEPGLWVPEPVGIADLLATGFEAGLVALLRSPLGTDRVATGAAGPVRFADVAIARTFGILAIAILTGAAILEHAGPG